MSKQYFDIGIIAPLEEEFFAIREIFGATEELNLGPHFAVVLDNTEGLRVIMILQAEMGRTAASTATMQLLADNDIGLFCCVGIAGALLSDLRIGDVCYTGSVWDVLDNAKFTDSSDGNAQLHLAPTTYSTDRNVTAALNQMRLSGALSANHQRWSDSSLSFAQSLIPGDFIGANGAIETVRAPRSVNGEIVCGSVAAGESYNRQLKQLNRRLIAIETESGGVFSVAALYSTPALTIRGVSDYGDGFKSELERTTSGNARKIAVRNAASFLKLQLNNPALLRFLDARRSMRDQAAVVPEVPAPNTEVPASVFLTVINRIIDSKLRELAPTYKLKPTGYRLPVPRIRVVDPEGDLNVVDLMPTDILEALTGRQHILINVPKSYPDHSTPWVFAADLSTAEVEGKQAIPVVLNGAEIRPPKHDFASLAPIDLAQLANCSDVLPIIIIDEFPLRSKSKLGFLGAQIAKYPDAKFIFISRGDGISALETSFVQDIGATVYDVCDVPFSEITLFLEKNFEMTSSAAEVVALRLLETFKKFDLAAHPTYFAGIPTEVLVTLMDANRRSELIQLAVDGTLTFVVAGDQADITLSRTTRQRFLRLLTVEMQVNKKNFTENELMEFTRIFAASHDFDIKPVQFIQAFIDLGILHFDGDYIQVSLPFIESYLLALELTRNESLASSYYDLMDEQFDFVSFDLYAEMGPNKKIISEVMEAIDLYNTELVRVRREADVILSDKIKPALLEHNARLVAVEAHLQRALDDVRSEKPNKAEKQRLIDAADRVRNSASRKADPVYQGGDERLSVLESALRVWSIGVVLLGSGAEHLSADEKRRLAASVVRTCAAALDVWLELARSIDFAQAKSEVQSEDAIRRIMNLPPEQELPPDSVRIFSALIDMVEFSHLNAPFRQLLGYLSEGARQRVLSASLENVKVDGRLERVILGSWLADIDAKKGLNYLRPAIRDLPPAPFIRVSLATHFISRVFWSHWKREEREALLEAAVDSLEPLAMQVDKGRYRRFIQGKRTGLKGPEN